MTARTEGDSSAAAPPEDGRVRVLGDFLHDFTSALTPIAMWIDLALDPEISEEQRLARLRTIDGLARRMGVFVAKLRGSLAIEAGREGTREPDSFEEVPAHDDRGLEAVSKLVRDAILLMREGGAMTFRASRAGDEVRIHVTGTRAELAAARAIVEAQGGAVRVEGANGEQSAISFAVPPGPG